MKIILFCNLPYAFSTLKPLADELQKQETIYLWYVPSSLVSSFPYKSMPHTSNIKNLEKFKSDIIFVPGNDVPYWIQGLKVQIFHGLAGEKKGHFRIRDHFDLYLTQGPYFTKRFKLLAAKHQNFDVIETGWSKLDKLYTKTQQSKQKKEQLLQQYNVKHIVLYAPTFSPSLTSALKLKKTIESLSKTKELLLLIKFHDKMDVETIKKYYNIKASNLVFVKEKDITESLQIADLMISDTSSVVYEFILLDKPVITLDSTSRHINWLNINDSEKVYEAVFSILKGNDTYQNKRKETIVQYHPYNDGKSSQRMIQKTKEYIDRGGTAKKRKVSIFRKLKIRKYYKDA